MRVRLEGRGNFDDRKDAIRKRIDNYNEGTKPVIQAYSKLAQLFEKTVGSPVKIIVFEMNDELMRVRLEGRGNFDDRKDAIRKRIDNYNEGTKPVIQAYSKLVKSVNADQSPDAVFSDVCKI